MSSKCNNLLVSGDEPLLWSWTTRPSSPLCRILATIDVFKSGLIRLLLQLNCVYHLYLIRHGYRAGFWRSRDRLCSQRHGAGDISSKSKLIGDYIQLCSRLHLFAWSYLRLCPCLLVLPAQTLNPIGKRDQQLPELSGQFDSIVPMKLPTTFIQTPVPETFSSIRVFVHRVMVRCDSSSLPILMRQPAPVAGE